MKNFAICASVILLTLAGPAAAQRVEGAFGEAFPGTREFSAALGEVSPPAAGGSAILKSPVNFLIRADLREPGSLTAFDTNSGDTVSVYRSEAGWSARLVTAGETETGTITAARGLSFTYTSGGAALTLERAGARYSFSGRVSGEPAAASGRGGGETFALELSGGRLDFSRRSVRGEAADPKLSGIMTALYLALLRDAGTGLLRAVDFGGRPGMDGPNYGWTACSDTGVPYVTTDVEYQQGAVSFGKVRVCEVEVTYTCHWKKCEELYPNLEPGRCYCKATCYKKTHNTGRCEVIDAE